jgi:small subunit ribosomal protein S8
MMSDPIADMLTRIRNAQLARKSTVTMPYSKLKHAIASILKEEGYVAECTIQDAHPKALVLELKYQGKQPMIQSITRESKPGHRQYRKAGELPRVLNDYGIAIVSTSRGLMTNKKAREAGIGGEVICSVY